MFFSKFLKNGVENLKMMGPNESFFPLSQSHKKKT
jgi:hypothetical protein